MPFLRVLVVGLLLAVCACRVGTPAVAVVSPTPSPVPSPSPVPPLVTLRLQPPCSCITTDRVEAGCAYHRPGETLEDLLAANQAVRCNPAAGCSPGGITEYRYCD